MYSSGRAAARGDLIRVVVDEKTSASKAHSLATARETTAAAAEATTGQESAVHDLVRNANLKLLPYNISGSSDFTGDGSTASSESLAASLTAQVVDVLPNDVLVIHGERLVAQGNEEVRMVLTGLVRKRDVTGDNTVLSTEIADARIRYVSTGDVSRGSSPGWLARILQWILPF
jgi:flagellar L-ring protein precursor FlgH